MDIESNKSVTVDERDETVAAPAPIAESAASVPVTSDVVLARAETVRTIRTANYTPSAVVAAVVAIAMLVLGGIAGVRAGIDGSLGQPVVTVAGFSATALLGLIVFGFGAMLLSAALARQQRSILTLGILGGVAGLIAVFEPTVGGESLPIERRLAILAVITMAAIVVSALLPTVSRVNTRQTTGVT